VGLALLLVLCLPVVGIQKLVPELSSFILRLAVLALLGAAAYSWFRSEQVPVQVTDFLDNFPGLKALLPEAGTPYFGLSAAVPLIVLLLPVLAILDVSRKSGLAPAPPPLPRRPAERRGRAGPRDRARAGAPAGVRPRSAPHRPAGGRGHHGGGWFEQAGPGPDRLR
jgi:hypothetical protein